MHDIRSTGVRQDVHQPLLEVSAGEHFRILREESLEDLDVLEVFADDVEAALARIGRHLHGRRCIMMSAPMGSKKTGAMGARHATGRLLAVSHRVALVENLAARLDLKGRLAQSGPEARLQGRTAPRLAITVQALQRCAERDFVADAVLVDEFAQVFDSVVLGNVHPTRRGQILRVFLKMLATAGRVWLADAFLDEELAKVMAKLIRASGAVDRPLLLIVRTPLRPRPAIELPNREAVLGRVVMAGWLNQRILVTSTSKADLERLSEVLRSRGIDHLLVTSRTAGRPEVREWCACPDGRWPVVLASPSISSGVSIEPGADGLPIFDEVCHVGVVHESPLSDHIQMTGRARGAPVVSYWVSRQAPPRPTSPLVEGRALERLASATAARLGHASPPPNLVDALGAWRAARGAGSWLPDPRSAMAHALTNVGYVVTRCIETRTELALRDEFKRAGETSISRRAREVCEGWVEPPMGELGGELALACDDLSLPYPVAPPTPGDQTSSAVEWREHVGSRTLAKIAVALAPGRAREADLLEVAWPRHDRQHHGVTHDLIHGALAAAGLGVEYLSAGREVTLTKDGLSAWVQYAEVSEDLLYRLLHIRAPEGSNGAVRSLSTLLERIGLEQVRHRRPRIDGVRQRVYDFRLHPEARAMLNRRHPGWSTCVVKETSNHKWTEPGWGGSVAASAEPSQQGATAPLFVLPSLRPVLDELRRLGDPMQLKRLKSYEVALGDSARTGQPLVVGRRWRELSGRIHVGGRGEPCIQNVARLLRPHLSAGPGRYCVAADWHAMHLQIAFALSGDLTLGELLAMPDCFAALAARLGCERATAKIVAYALLNGASARTVGRELGSQAQGRRLFRAWSNAFPVLNAYRQRRAAEWAQQGYVELPRSRLDTGESVRVAASDAHKAVALDWLSMEARALDAAIAEINATLVPEGCRIFVEMYDGIVIDCPPERERAAAETLRLIMLRAAQRVLGVPVPVKVGIGATWGEAEETAR